MLALVGGIGSAFAQTAGGGKGGAPSGGAPGGSSGSASAVILLGTPGNCPPTLACATTVPAPVVEVKPRQACSDRRGPRDIRFTCRPDEI